MAGREIKFYLGLEEILKLVSFEFRALDFSFVKVPNVLSKFQILFENRDKKIVVNRRN